MYVEKKRLEHPWKIEGRKSGELALQVLRRRKDHGLGQAKSKTA